MWIANRHMRTPRHCAVASGPLLQSHKTQIQFQAHGNLCRARFDPRKLNQGAERLEAALEKSRTCPAGEQGTVPSCTKQTGLKLPDRVTRIMERELLQ